jgi:ElaB/YqjD/DUF883 family membrane-anchored ribosome-binding protein
MCAEACIVLNLRAIMPRTFSQRSEYQPSRREPRKTRVSGRLNGIAAAFRFVGTLFARLTPESQKYAGVTGSRARINFKSDYQSKAKEITDMSQNFGNNDPQNKGGNKGTTGGSGISAGSGRTDEGTTRDTGATGSSVGGGGSVGGGAATGGSGAAGGATGGALSTTGGGTGAGTATAREGLAGTAQEYGQKITDAASTAKDYVSDKISVAGDKLKDLQNVDYRQVAEDAKNYAREKPGQALLISAAAGFLIGLLLKSSNRR